MTALYEAWLLSNPEHIMNGWLWHTDQGQSPISISLSRFYSQTIRYTRCLRQGRLLKQPLSGCLYLYIQPTLRALGLIFFSFYSVPSFSIFFSLMVTQAKSWTSKPRQTLLDAGKQGYWDRRFFFTWISQRACDVMISMRYLWAQR